MSFSTGIPRTRLALVGAGRVGTTIAYHLRRAGHEVVGVASRSKSSEQRASELLGAPALGWSSRLPDADVVLLGVSEAALEEVARLLAPQLREGAIVIHAAGAFGFDVLKDAIAVGAKGAALHPVQALPSIEQGIERLPGSSWGVTCEPDIHHWCHSLIAGDLRGKPVDVPQEARPLWHAAAVATSNGLSALMAVGERILTSIDIASPEEVLGPLAAGTLANAVEGGGGGATLTGPVVRGEADTVERHLRALQSTPQLMLPYKLAAALVLESAVAGGRITDAAAAEMRALLEGIR